MQGCSWLHGRCTQTLRAVRQCKAGGGCVADWGEGAESGGGGVVDKETVKESVESVMGGEEESLETRKRAKKYQAKARAAIEEGGS